MSFRDNGLRGTLRLLLSCSHLAPREALAKQHPSPEQLSVKDDGVAVAIGLRRRWHANHEPSIVPVRLAVAVAIGLRRRWHYDPTAMGTSANQGGGGYRSPTSLARFTRRSGSIPQRSVAVAIGLRRRWHHDKDGKDLTDRIVAVAIGLRRRWHIPFAWSTRMKRTVAVAIGLRRRWHGSASDPIASPNGWWRWLSVSDVAGTAILHR